VGGCKVANREVKFGGNLRAADFSFLNKDLRTFCEIDYQCLMMGDENLRLCRWQMALRVAALCRHNVVS